MNCPRGMNPRHHDVYVSDHGWRRYKQRCGYEIMPHQERKERARLTNTLRTRLNIEVSTGLELDWTGVAKIWILPVLYAVVVLESNGWVAITFKIGVKEAG